jgi:hypothetical protein
VETGGNGEPGGKRTIEILIFAQITQMNADTVSHGFPDFAL